jgi:hypothetical protein
LELWWWVSACGRRFLPLRCGEDYGPTAGIAALIGAGLAGWIIFEACRQNLTFVLLIICFIAGSKEFLKPLSVSDSVDGDWLGLM